MSTPLAELIRTAFEAAHATGARNVDAYVVGWLSAEAHIHHELDRLRRPPIPAPVVLPAVVLPAIPLRPDRDAVGPEDEGEYRR